jgi:hypothetical protein
LTRHSPLRLPNREGYRVLIRSQSIHLLHSILIGLKHKAIVLLRRKRSILLFAIWPAVRAPLGPPSQIRLRLSRRLPSTHHFARHPSLMSPTQWCPTNLRPPQHDLSRSVLRQSVTQSLHLPRRPDTMPPLRQGLASNSMEVPQRREHSKTSIVASRARRPLRRARRTMMRTKMGTLTKTLWTMKTRWRRK